MGMETFTYFVTKVTRGGFLYDCKVREGEEKVGSLPFTHKLPFFCDVSTDHGLRFDLKSSQD